MASTMASICSCENSARMGAAALARRARDRASAMEARSRSVWAMAYAPLESFGAFGRTFSTSAWGRGITCTETSSPTRRAAAAPASVAAFTAPTSPATGPGPGPGPVVLFAEETDVGALPLRGRRLDRADDPPLFAHPKTTPAQTLIFCCPCHNCCTIPHDLHA